ncbi:hypothetical protein HHL16_19185 [Pseudoflavitalea sp. G-6-1-2]|nr:hypothetical protein [Pseudoflavitalea sp. G-6-1-2]
MSRSTAIETISGLLILLFMYTAISKFVSFKTFMVMLKLSPLVKSHFLFVAFAVPIVEIIISGLLFFQRTKKIGFLSSFILMLIFTLYIAYFMLFADDKPCSCGGVISQMTWGQHLVFNIFFTFLAFLGYRLMKKGQPEDNLPFKAAIQ